MSLRKWHQWEFFTGPFIDIGKDFVSTFRPYKSKQHWQTDALQPIYGIGYITVGVAAILTSLAYILIIVGTPLIAFSLVYTCPLIAVSLLALPLLMDLAYLSLTGKTGGIVVNLTHSLWQASKDCLLFFAYCTAGIPLLIRGITQIATTPLTWLFKIPLRLILTKVYGYQKIEDDKGLNRLINKLKLVRSDWPSALPKIPQKISLKIAKARKQGRDVPKGFERLFSNEDVFDIYNEIKNNSASFGEYLKRDFPNTEPYLSITKSNTIDIVKQVGLVTDLRGASNKSKEESQDKTPIATTLRKHGVFVNRAALTMMLCDERRYSEDGLPAPLNDVPGEIWQKIAQHAAILPEATAVPEQTPNAQIL